jgi:hypothetical protein
MTPLGYARATWPKPQSLHSGARKGSIMQLRSSPRGAVSDGGKQDGEVGSPKDSGLASAKACSVANARKACLTCKLAQCVWITESRLVRGLQPRA